MTLPPFQRLVDEHWYAVARLAHALAGPVDGDDVAQQAWSQALAAYPNLRTGTNLRGWLLTITARCAIDLHRARVRQPVPVGDQPDGVAPRGIGPAGPVGSGGRGSGQVGAAGSDPPEPPDDELWAAVRALPDRQRTAVALRYVADLDHAEIARALATTPAATRRLVSDALAALRRMLPPRPALPPTRAPTADPTPRPTSPSASRPTSRPTSRPAHDVARRPQRDPEPTTTPTTTGPAGPAHRENR